MYNRETVASPSVDPPTPMSIGKIMQRAPKPVAGILGLAVLACLAWSPAAHGLDHVVFERDGRQVEIAGQLLVSAEDGGLLVMARDGVLWAVQPEELVKHTADETPFEPWSAEELSRRLLAELPDGFNVHATTHYLICYNTSRPYAQWCGSLFERLYMGFTNYWSRRGFDLLQPRFPLVAIVFSDRRSYVDFSQAEVGEAVKSIIGYFSLTTNRMVMYDLTGLESLGIGGGRGGTSAQINRILAQPDAARTVATVVHEATHQIAFNCGLHTRYSDCPLWFSEGIAIYFETPDLRSAKGWRGIGEINRPRLAQFRDYLRRRPPDSLATLVADDKRFQDTRQGLDAYAEAWALTYFLLNRYRPQYLAYLERLSEKKPMLYDDAEARLAEFQEAFGDLQKLDAEFVRFMMRMR